MSIETYPKDAAEQLPGQSIEPGALEARVGSARPLELGAPDQMPDTPLHTQDPGEPDCLLQSARMAEHKQTGQDPGLDAYKQPAIEKGLYNEGGTRAEGFEEIINERPGLRGEMRTGDGPQDIKDALDQGRSVIAGVDAFEFYKGQANLPDDGTGHAVVVTGADQAPDGSWDLTVNDPNVTTPNVPVEGDRFLPAWEKTGRPMFVIERAGGGR